MPTMQYTKITQTNRIEMEEFVMKDFLKKIYSLISTMLIALSDYLQSAHEQKQQQQLAIQQQNQNYCIRLTSVSVTTRFGVTPLFLSLN